MSLFQCSAMEQALSIMCVAAQRDPNQVSASIVKTQTCNTYRSCSEFQSWWQNSHLLTCLGVWMTPKLSSFIFVSNERCFSFQYQTEAPFINQCTFVSSLSKRGRFQWWKRLAWVRKTYMVETFEKTWNSSRVTVVDDFILWYIISLWVFVFWAQKMFSLFFSWLASGQKWREFKIKARRNSWAVEHRSQFPVPPAESDEEDEDTSWLGHEIKYWEMK